MEPQVPSRFADEPVAAATQWSPLAGGGTTFRTRLFQQVDSGRVEFVATTIMRMFPWFVLAGTALSVGVAIFMYNYLAGDRGIAQLIEQKYFLPLICLASVPFAVLPCVGIAIYIWWKGHHPIVFDQTTGFVKGDPAKGATVTPLEEIAGLQIIGEVVQSRGADNTSTSFLSYELNLVRNDASRRNVVDHGNLTALRQDAAMLAEFLDVPVWDAVRSRKKRR